MIAGIRTPAQVIALVLEEAGMPPGESRITSEAAARRLAVALRSVSGPGHEVVIRSRRKGEIEWATVSPAATP